MPGHWCVNFESDANLQHGIDENLWMMGYQYAHNQSDSRGRKIAISRNWGKLDKMEVGDKFLAYLPVNRFYATGTVRLPRRPQTSQDSTDTIAEYLKRGKSYQAGYVYFTSSVVYENFTDGFSGYPVRIDVEEWENHVPHGVTVSGLDIPRHKTVNAAFEIDKSDFDRIAKELAAQHKSRQKSSMSLDGPSADELFNTATQVAESGYFSPSSLKDERKKTVREIVERRGQPDFRNKLIVAYGGRCTVTGCDAVAALEAAHIVPYSGPQSHHVTNGLLIRADIHTLFDLDLIGINPESLTISLAAPIKGTVYGDLQGRKLTLPTKATNAPNQEALAERWKRFGEGAKS